MEQPHSNLDADLLVIGGGVNGAGIARDAAGRGLRVVLCEQGDLAEHTSSASTKLIHGGLRYLENYDFALVRHALQEREVLLNSAPHIIWPLHFILPHNKHLRPRWMIRLGLFLYDHLGGKRRLPASRMVDFRTHPAGETLKSEFAIGYEYSDCWVQDSRLVALAALDARQRGARILTRAKVVGLERAKADWLARVAYQRNGTTGSIRAKALVNASGPWVDLVHGLDENAKPRHSIRGVKGSHVILPRLFDHDYPYIFQHTDGRILFAIPFEGDFTLLGTTDVELNEIPDSAQITPAEIDYICSAVGEYLKREVNPKEVVWNYSGVRPLFDDAVENASKVTRDYHLDLDTDAAPLLSVYGGKITTFRRLAEEALDLLAGAMTVPGRAWTREARLPGGDIPNADFGPFLTACHTRYPWLPAKLVRRYARNYGTRIGLLLERCENMGDLGRHFGGMLYQREIEYLKRHEFAESAADILWRRTKQGLFLSPEEISTLERWLSNLNASSAFARM